MISTMKRLRKPSQPKRKYPVWPPPQLGLPPADILEAIDRGDDRPFRNWQRRMKRTPQTGRQEQQLLF